MTFDEKLAQALENTAKARAEQMLVVEKKHRFSLAYRLWEYKTLRNLRKNRYDNRWTLRKARYILTAIIAAFSLLLGVTAYAITAIGRYSFDSKHDYSKLFIENLSTDKTYFEEYYGLSEADGWQIIEYSKDILGTMINYKCGEKRVTLSQNIIHDGSMGNVNTENATIEPMSVFEENDGFFIQHNEEECSLWWSYNGYLLEVGGNITKKEAVDLAYSTKIINLE